MLRISCNYCGRAFKSTFRYINWNKKRGSKNYCSRKCVYKVQSKTRSGKNNPMYGRAGEKNPFYNKIHSGTTRMKMRGPRPSIQGENNPNWKGGITPQNRIERTSLKYKEFIKYILKRDNYMCLICGDSKGGNLEIDHIMPWSLFKKLRQDSGNVRTLCKPCHSEYGSNPKYKPVKWAISPIR